MSHKKLERWLKSILVLLGLCGAVFYGYIIPVLKIHVLSDIGGTPTLWAVLYILTAIPCYMVLVAGWSIAKRIGDNNSFCRENVKSFKNISVLAIIDTVYFFFVNILMLICGLDRMYMLFMAMVIVFIGVAISVAAAILSHLVEKATAIREENEEII